MRKGSRIAEEKGGEVEVEIAGGRSKTRERALQGVVDERAHGTCAREKISSRLEADDPELDD